MNRADGGVNIVMYHFNINCGEATVYANDQSKGQYRVGISFNPSKNPTVDEIKAKAAELIDAVEDIPDKGNPEVARLKSLAQSEIESAAMWAVKAATKEVQ
jgi:hypothetical protein